MGVVQAESPGARSSSCQACPGTRLYKVCTPTWPEPRSSAGTSSASARSNLKGQQCDEQDSNSHANTDPSIWRSPLHLRRRKFPQGITRRSKAYGLSAFYALRILVDFQRGDSIASRFITMDQERPRRRALDQGKDILKMTASATRIRRHYIANTSNLPAEVRQAAFPGSGETITNQQSMTLTQEISEVTCTHCLRGSEDSAPAAKENPARAVRPGRRRLR